MKNQITKSLAAILTLVLGMACSQSAVAQTFKNVKVAGNAPVSQVAAGGVSVWALANGSPYLFNGKTFVLQLAVAMQPNLMQSGGSIPKAISTVPSRAVPSGPSLKSRVCLTTFRWALGTATAVIPMRYGDSILPRRSIATTTAPARSNSNLDLFAISTSVVETYGGPTAGPMSFASISRPAFSTKFPLHFRPFLSLRLARTGTCGQPIPAIRLFTSTMKSRTHSSASGVALARLKLETELGYSTDKIFTVGNRAH